MRSISFALVLLSLPPLWAQSTWARIVGQVGDASGGKPLKGVVVVAADTSDLSERWGGTVDIKNRFELKLPFDHTYLITVQAEDRWSKSVVVDLHGVKPDEREAGLTLTIDLSLMKPFELADPGLKDLPMGYAVYDPKKRNIVWDEAYSTRMKRRWEVERKRGRK